MKTAPRLEGLTLTVNDVKRSVEFYTAKLGFVCEWNAAPAFAMIRIGGAGGGTIGLLSYEEAIKEGYELASVKQNLGVHVELSTDNLDGLYEELRAKGMKFETPPHDEPWERSATALDPDGYSIEFSQGRRGENKTSTTEKTWGSKN
jgi:catechol 2,3-dioxygenase-like lactoylglutathione lyase family enzyme